MSPPQGFDLDVAIVGAGFAGAATAWALTEAFPHLRVHLFERERQLGRFASGRSAGMGRQLAEDDDTTALTVAGARALREHGSGRFWHERGGLLTFDDDAHAAAYVARAATHGVSCERLDSPALGRRGLLAHAGVFVPSDGLIDVLPLLEWLLERATARGARLSLGTPVTGVDGLAGGARLDTAAGALTCRALVDASGAWAGQLFGEALLPLRRHVMAVDDPARATPRTSLALGPELHADGPFVWHLGQREVYLRPRPDGTWLTSPCDERLGDAGDQTTNQDAHPELSSRMAHLAPAWLPACSAPRETWSCQRTFTPDRRVRITRDPTRPYLVWAAALGGHGATAACAIGARAAELVLRALEK